MAPPATMDLALEQIEALRRENKILREQLHALKHHLFGRRSERLEPGQMRIFDDEGPAPAIVDEPAPVATEASKKSVKQGHGRASFPEHLPREVIELDVPDEDRDCPDCGKAMQAFGEEILERGHIVPAQFVVRRYVKKRYACPDGHAVKTAPPPDGVIDKGKYEASVYAHLATAKYADHLPLHRLEGIFKRNGLHLAKQSMWDMLVRVDELVAQPILAQIRAELLQEPVLHADETPVTMRVEGGKGTSTAYVWSWRSLSEAAEPKALVEFRTSRGRDGPVGFLRGWSGTLITDGYSGYDEAIRQNEIVRAGCMAHARRKVKDALDAGSKSAVRLLRPIQRLFWLERAVLRRAKRDGLEYEGLLALRASVRERRSAVAWARLREAVGQVWAERGTLPKSLLGKALGYLDNQEVPLATFLKDPRVPIHNNDSERDLRHVAIGRKNWLVFGSSRGGNVACRLYSLVLSCKESGVDPQAYIEDVLKKVAIVPASQIATLTPWGWKRSRDGAATS